MVVQYIYFIFFTRIAMQWSIGWRFHIKHVWCGVVRYIIIIAVFRLYDRVLWFYVFYGYLSIVVFFILHERFSIHIRYVL